MSDYIRGEKLNKILPSLLKAEIGGRHLPHLFVEKKIASAERIVLTCLRHGLNQAYFLVDGKDLYQKNGFESTHEVYIMPQVVVRGYFLLKCDGENKIILCNPKTNDTMISPEFPSVKKTMVYVGHWADTFTLLSLVLRDDDDVVEEVWVLVFNAENPQWTKVDTTNLYLYNQTMDIDGQYEDVVVSFGLLFHSLKVH